MYDDGINIQVSRCMMIEWAYKLVCVWWVDLTLTYKWWWVVERTYKWVDVWLN